MKKSDVKYKRRLAVFAVLAALTAVFIFSNSLQPPDESNSRSLALAMWLYRLPFFRNMMTGERFHELIRKLAHFTEFGALGVFLGGAVYNLGKIKNEKYISLPMLISLGTAVCDEFIQSFTGRTSAVSDVLIDFSGALCGILLIRGIASHFEKKKPGNDK